ncbi:MAG: lipoyl synthase [Pseudomonadota bacterium]
MAGHQLVEDRCLAPSRTHPEGHQRGLEKLRGISVQIVAPQPTGRLPKPPWIRVKAAQTARLLAVRRTLREHGLRSVCEEALCPNLSECFSQGTATFLILGDLCTRRCPFCDVAHGRPGAPDPEEPVQLASAVAALGLHYVVVTSVDRDDLRDGGASHFAACVAALRRETPDLVEEILTPDFRGRLDTALEALSQAPPDVFNHNLETVPRLYPSVRPGADYHHSLALLKRFRTLHPDIPTKSGLMLGLGETLEEIRAVLRDLRVQDCQRLTLGQYLAPSTAHYPVARYVPPEEFTALGDVARALGFRGVASAPLVRSSYHAEWQAQAG